MTKLLDGEWMISIKKKITRIFTYKIVGNKCNCIGKHGALHILLPV
jgi:hypothetical protein